MTFEEWHLQARWFKTDEPLARAAWDWALEEAAKVSESYEPHCDACPRGVANAIRSLKSAPHVAREQRLAGKGYEHARPVGGCADALGLTHVDPVNTSPERVEEAAEHRHERKWWLRCAACGNDYEPDTAFDPKQADCCAKPELHIWSGTP